MLKKKLLILAGQIYFVIWKNTFCDINKYNDCAVHNMRWELIPLFVWPALLFYITNLGRLWWRLGLP